MTRFAKMNRCLAITGLLLLVFLHHGNAGEAPAAEALPERIVLNMTRTPHDSQAVTWRSREKGTAPVAQIVPLSGLVNPEKGVSTFQADSCQVELDDGKGVFHHAVVFDSLSPDTEYAYRVGDDSRWSEWSRFRTGSDKPDPFTFLYFGDIQKQIRTLCSQLIRTAVLAAPDAAFWLFAGDMVDNGPDDREWAEFFEALSWMPRTFPLVPVPGNHEYPDPRITYKDEQRITRLWRPLFTLPDNGPPGLEETVYHFEYQGMRIIVLNGNEQIETQAAWIKTVLSRNKSAWTIVAVHQPVYSISEYRNNTAFQQVLVPVFDRFSVDLVLQGHDHGYARTRGLKNHNPAVGSEKGTVYIISNSGPKFYPISDRYDHLMARTATGGMLYHTIQVDGNTLRFTAFDLMSQPVDSVVIQKNNP